MGVEASRIRHEARAINPNNNLPQWKRDKLVQTLTKKKDKKCKWIQRTSHQKIKDIITETIDIISTSGWKIQSNC